MTWVRFPRVRAARPFPMILVLSTLFGCAHSLVRDGVVRPEAYQDLLERTAAARGLEPERELTVRVITRSEIPELTRESIETHYASDSLEAYQESLVTLGIWPADRDLVDEYAAVGSEESAGFYRPSKRTLYVVDDARIPFSLRLASWLSRRDLFRDFALAHEIVHALQHQAQPWLLEEGIAWRQQDDAAMAIRTAIEGEATVYGYMVFLEAGSVHSLPDPEWFREGVEEEMARLRSDGALAAAPALIRYSLMFPYVEGYGLSFSEGETFLEDPPISTEQVLHANRRRAFLALDLRGARSLLPADCRLLDENTLGELGISILLRDLGGEISSAAWIGWDGDRYLTARCGEKREFVWLTTWDSELDAEEFTVAYAEIAEAVRTRAGLSAAPRAVQREREVWVASVGLVGRAEELAAAARRRRVSRLEELRSHFAESGGPSEER